jgi:hypothetical protein
MKSAQYLVLSALLLAFLAARAEAFIFPYSVRTQNYSSWTPATRGDTNTIGMAGATVALPTSISAAEPNPAGYGMTTGSVSAQINSVSLHDSRLQRTGEPIDSSEWGLGVSPDHWGFSIAYYSPETESGTYVSPNTGDTAVTEVSLKEFRFTVARTFFVDRLSIGATFEITKAVREINDISNDCFGTSYQLGALYRLPNHVLLGLSYMPEVTVGPASNTAYQAIMPGFNQTVARPLLVTFGSGWIPNRFFKMGASVTYAGNTENTALLYDQTITTGARPTWVPRMGVSYVLAEYSNFKVEGAAGSYYEFSRLSSEANRLHVTAGLEANPYFINLGAGFDVAIAYQNFIVSVGVDIVRAARAFDIIPKESVPPYNGLFPRVTHISPDGLPSGLTRGEQSAYQATSVEQVGKIVEEVPQNIAKKLQGEKTTVELREIDKKAEKKPTAPRRSKPTQNPSPRPSPVSP